VVVGVCVCIGVEIVGGGFVWGAVLGGCDGCVCALARGAGITATAAASASVNVLSDI